MLPVIWPYAAGLIYAVTEYWLGRTDKVKAGSVVEVVLNSVAAVAGAFKKKDA